MTLTKEQLNEIIKSVKLNNISRNLNITENKGAVEKFKEDIFSKEVSDSDMTEILDAVMDVIDPNEILGEEFGLESMVAGTTTSSLEDTAVELLEPPVYMTMAEGAIEAVQQVYQTAPESPGDVYARSEPEEVSQGYVSTSMADRSIENYQNKHYPK